MISKPSILFISLASLGLQSQMESCNEHNYVNPLNGFNQRYHAIPLTNDSVKTATYVTAAYFGGSTNEGDDALNGAKFSGYKTWQISKNLQSYLGADFVFGRYRFDPSYPIPAYNNVVPGNKSFGSVGLQGGINLVVPFKKMDWRPIGIQISTHQEFGSYLRFRQSLHTERQQEGVIIPQANYTTIGLTTELTGKVGYYMSFGWILNRGYHSQKFSGSYESSSPTYLNASLHYTFLKKHTFYLSNTFSNPSFFFIFPNSFSDGIEVGYIYRLK